MPSQEYEYAIWQELKVHRDHHIVFEGSFYSVPTQYVGTIVWIRASQRVIDIYVNHQRIKRHIRSHNRGQWITDPQDYPQEARTFLEKDKEFCLEKGHSIGYSTHQILTKVLEKPGFVSQRKSQAILKLADQYGTHRLEATCRRAIAFDNYTYRSLKSILVQSLDQRPLYEDDAGQDPLPRHGSYLRERHEFQPLQGAGL